MKLRGAIALALLGVLSVAVTPARAASTRADYIAQVDPICQTTNDAVAHAARGIQSDEKKGRFKIAARKLRNEIPLQRTGVEGVAAVEPPASDAQLIGTWVQMLRAQFTVAKRLANDFAHRHIRAAAKVYVRFHKMIRQTEALVAGFGFHYCQLM